MSKGLHQQPHTSIYIDATLPPGIHYAPSYDKRRNRVYPRFRATWIGPDEQYKRNKSFVFASIHVDEYPIGLRDVSVYRIARALASGRPVSTVVREGAGCWNEGMASLYLRGNLGSSLAVVSRAPISVSDWAGMRL